MSFERIGGIVKANELRIEPVITDASILVVFDGDHIVGYVKASSAYAALQRWFEETKS